ncbi:MAG: HAD-IC family P-type ATPase [Allosphingosinicella sp.]
MPPGQPSTTVTLRPLAEADLALFDKTGTLTLGRPAPSLDSVPDDARPILAALARRSRHPLSRAIAAALETTPVAAVDDLREIPGFGLKSLCVGQPVSLGRPAAAEGMATELRIGDRAWTIGFEDRLRPEVAATLRRLDRLGIPSSIASGDRAAAVAPVARELGLTAQTGMHPRDKLDAIARLSGAGHKVLMVGDGLNDGPALAAGHASMAPRPPPTSARTRPMPSFSATASRPWQSPSSPHAGRCASSDRISRSRSATMPSPCRSRSWAR